jgi:hypothetical protein
MFRRAWNHVVVLLSLTLLLSAGCSDLPTALSTQADTAANQADGSVRPVLGLLGGGSATTKTVGVLGGILRAGDFTVVIPPAALSSTATVTVSQPDLAKPVVHLSISPSSANRFLVPVVLTGDLKRMNPSLVSVACLSYFNPKTGKWEDLTSTVSVLNLTVSTPLWHFSTYRVSARGKAGW